MWLIDVFVPPWVWFLVAVLAFTKTYALGFYVGTINRNEQNEYVDGARAAGPAYRLLVMWTLTPILIFIVLWRLS